MLAPPPSPTPQETLRCHAKLWAWGLPLVRPDLRRAPAGEDLLSVIDRRASVGHQPPSVERRPPSVTRTPTTDDLGPSSGNSLREHFPNPTRPPLLGCRTGRGRRADHFDTTYVGGKVGWKKLFRAKTCVPEHPFTPSKFPGFGLKSCPKKCGLVLGFNGGCQSGGKAT